MRFEKPTYQELSDRVFLLEQEIENLKSGGAAGRVETVESAEKEKRITAALSRVGLGIVTTDMDGRVVSMNPVAEVLTGQSERATSGMSLEDVLNIVDSGTGEQHDELAAGVINKGAIVIFKDNSVLLAADGRKRPVWGRGAIIKDESGAKQGALFVFREITKS